MYAVDIGGYAGPVPAALAAIGNLVYLDVSYNDLSGSLKPFADVLAANVNSTALVYLDVADNELTGPIPAGLSSSAILDPNIDAEIAPGCVSVRLDVPVAVVFIRAFICLECDVHML